LALGDTVFAIRLPACLCALGTTLLLAKLMPRYGLLAAVLFTPAALFGGILTTPDAPLILFWTAYLVWLARAQEHFGEPAADAARSPGRHLGLWVAGGVLLGLGILGKYTRGLVLPAALASFLAVRPWRRWLGGFALHGLVAFVTAAPILLYNLQTEFVPLTYQWRHAMA